MLKYVHDVKRHLALYSMVDIVTGSANSQDNLSKPESTEPQPSISRPSKLVIKTSVMNINI